MSAMQGPNSLRDGNGDYMRQTAVVPVEHPALTCTRLSRFVVCVSMACFEWF